MIVAVEGPDGCGKTVFTQQISERLGIPVITNHKFAVGEKRDDGAVLAQAQTVVPFAKAFDFIHDRFIMTNHVYEWVFNGLNRKALWEGLIVNMPILIVYLRTTYDVLVMNLLKRHHETGQAEEQEIIFKLPFLFEYYEDVAKDWRIKFRDNFIVVEGMRDFQRMWSEFSQQWPKWFEDYMIDKRRKERRGAIHEKEV